MFTFIVYVESVYTYIYFYNRELINNLLVLKIFYDLVLIVNVGIFIDLNILDFSFTYIQ